MRLRLLFAIPCFSVVWCDQPQVVTLHKIPINSSSNALLNSPPIELTNEQFQEYGIIPEDLWAQISRPVPPPYPLLAKANGFSGPVEIVIEVNDAGELVRLNARRSKAYHAALIPTAQSWASHLKFPPSASDVPIRKFRIYVVFTAGVRVEIQPTPDSHFTQMAAKP